MVRFKYVRGMNTEDLINNLNEAIKDVDSQSSVKVSYNDKLTQAIVEIDDNIVTKRLTKYVEDLSSNIAQWLSVI